MRIVEFLIQHWITCTAEPTTENRIILLFKINSRSRWYDVASLESIKKYKNKANNNSEVYKYGYEVTNWIEAFNYLIQNACKEFVVNDSGEVNFEKGLLDNIYTYIFSGIWIDEKTILSYTETTVCKDEFA